MKMTKRISALCMVVLCIVLLVCTASASSIPAGVVCYHGNNNSTSKCYAQTKQSSNNYTIGAQITWQLSGSSDLVYGPRENSLGAKVTSSSRSLRGRSGQSFGYYYANNKLIHESTAWMDFSF